MNRGRTFQKEVVVHSRASVQFRHSQYRSASLHHKCGTLWGRSGKVQILESRPGDACCVQETRFRREFKLE